MADYSDGLANFAAAIGNYMAARKRRKMEQEDREDRRLEREERRRDIDEDRKFKREMATADMDFRREYLDRVAPKKDLLDRIMEGVKGILPSTSPQDRLINSQAMYNERLAGLLGQPGMPSTGFPTTAPIGAGRGNVAKAPKPPKAQGGGMKNTRSVFQGQPPRGMVQIEKAMMESADEGAAAIHRYLREEGIAITGDVVSRLNLKKYIAKNIGLLEKKWNRKLSEEELSAFEEILRNAVQNKVLASGGAR